jgi:multiple sugar transport system substrate-binding protein
MTIPTRLALALKIGSAGPIGQLVRLAAVIVGIAIYQCSPATAQTTINVLYAVPSNFKKLQEDIAARFAKERPDIKIVFWNPAATYEEGVQQVLRGNISGEIPDVVFTGLNQIRVFVDRNLAVSLESFAAADQGFEKLGYLPSMISLGRIAGRPYGLPFAISTPVLYVNGDLVKKAGGNMESFPKDWDAILALSQKIAALPDKPTGFSFQWDASGNWMYQALVNSKGGRYASDDGCEFELDSAEGKWALEMLEAFNKSGMPDLTWQQSRQAFDADTVGIVAGSTSYVTQAGKKIGNRFNYRTMPFPVPAANGRLPAGGTIATMLTKNDQKQKAAWDYMKYATGPVAQTMMATYTGYMPGNKYAVEDPKLLGDFYKVNENSMTSIRQLPIITAWYAWPGENGIKIIDVMKDHIASVVRGRRPAAEAMPDMVKDVKALLPSCTR